MNIIPVFFSNNNVFNRTPVPCLQYISFQFVSILSRLIAHQVRKLIKVIGNKEDSK